MEGGRVEGREGVSIERRAKSVRLSNQGGRAYVRAQAHRLPERPPPASSVPMDPGRGPLCVCVWVRGRGV